MTFHLTLLAASYIIFRCCMDMAEEGRRGDDESSLFLLFLGLGVMAVAVYVVWAVLRLSTEAGAGL